MVKKLFTKVHLWLGLVSGLVVLVVSLTGCIYVFEEELRSIYPKYRFVNYETDNAQKLSIGAIIEGASIAYPDKEIQQIRWYQDPQKKYQVKFHNGESAYMDPYSGEITAVFSHDWLWYVEKIHTSLLLGDFGKWIIRVNILIFLALLLTGLYLWWPSKLARRKQAFRLKTNGSWKRLNYDLHSVLGFYGLFILILITLTGMWWSFDWYKQTVYAVLGEKYEKPKPLIVDVNIVPDFRLVEHVFENVMGQNPGAVEAHIDIYKEKNHAARMRLEYPRNWYKKRNEYFYHPQSGVMLEERLYADYSKGEIYKHANYEIHTGRGFGLMGKIIAFLASFLAASLPVSGFYIWYGRTFKKKIPRASKAGEYATVPFFSKIKLAK